MQRRKGKIYPSECRVPKSSKEKDPDAGKYCRWKEKVTTEDETVGWHH